MDLALRPMSTSQVLDRTFFLYKNNFVLFAGIAIITPTLRLIAVLVQLKLFGPLVMPQQPEAVTTQFFQGLFVQALFGAVAGTIVYLIGTALASSATAYAVSMVHLGKTTTIAESYRKVKPIFFKILWLLCLVLFFSFGPLILCYILLFGIGFLAASMVKGGGQQMGLAVIMMGVGFVTLLGILAALVWMIYVFCRYAFAVPACTLEKLPAGSSLTRSRFLTDGAKWSVAGLVFLTVILSAVVTYALELPALLVNNGSLVPSATNPMSMVTTVWVYIAQFLGGTVTGPITTIALVLMYYDQRVRKEAFDIQLMMEAVGQQTPTQTQTATAAPPALG
jgi:hypothetical protein